MAPRAPSPVPDPASWTRRRALALALLPLGLAAGEAGAQEGAQGPILVLSRRRMLNETRHARALLEAEQRMTAELQARVDQTKRRLAAEEQRLAELRSSLPREEFDQRTSAFDRMVRRERREAQRQAAALQTVFRSLRVRMLETLDRFLGRVRADRGATLILDAENALAWDPSIDITDEVIARFDEAVPPPEIPDLDTILSGASREEQ